MKTKCAHCDEEHDLANMEPSHAMPDVVHQMTPLERKLRVKMNKDLCVVNGITAPAFSGATVVSREHFLRVLLPIPVAGREPCRWGVWVQVPDGAFEQVLEVWDKDERTGLIWSGQLANALPGYVVSLGLPGVFSFRNLTDIPYLTLDDDKSLTKEGYDRGGRAQLVTDQRDGVPSTRALEWLLAIHHPGATS